MAGEPAEATDERSAINWGWVGLLGLFGLLGLLRRRDRHEYVRHDSYPAPGEDDLARGTRAYETRRPATG
ncbi:MAG: WGxxGxxG family protein [Burkholderiales bacterium]